MPAQGHRHLLTSSIVATTIAVALVDFALPPGLLVWIFYLVPIGLTIFLPTPHSPLIVGAVCAVVKLSDFLFLEHDSTLPSEVVLLNRIFGITTIVVISVIASRAIADRVAVVRQERIRRGQATLANAMRGEESIEALGEALLSAVAGHVGAPAGALHATGDDGSTRAIAAYGLPVGEVMARSAQGAGLPGQVARDDRLRVLAPVPEGFLTLRTGLGAAAPRAVVVAPAHIDGRVEGVLELALLGPVEAEDLELLEVASEQMGAALRAAKWRARLQNLVEETQRQSEELQVQQEELRVSNEELEEQGKTLRESQSRMEAQHAELEATNTQLAEQAHAVQRQRDELSGAHRKLLENAAALERASRYKSEFLANMSHELRTPLNSSLILARLLADNKHGNLDAEQVKYAQTIHAAGTDLLTLINDILDLSKIEAGKLQLRAETVDLAALLEALARQFEPLAGEKRLALTTRLSEDAPARIETDPRRLEQVLKNLLANAIKFTDRGSVALVASPEEDGRIAFSVTDTGIGIPDGEREMIFEAFRQGDGGLARRHGGTGLGLSISRELAHLLGGEIELETAPGEGSTFTLLLPTTAPERRRREAEEEEADVAMLASGAGVAPPFVAAAEGGAVREAASASAARGALQASAGVATATPPPAPPRARRAGRGAPRPPSRSGRSAAGSARFPAEEAPPEAPAVADDRAALLPGRRVILVIEDDARFAAVLRDLAHEKSFQCLVASTAEAGVALATEHVPAAIILDMSLPDHSGLLVLDRVKRSPRTRHIPVHVCSATDYSAEALAMGAVGYALKPVRREDLITTFESLAAKLDDPVRRVLVVENDGASREATATLLESETVRTTGAATLAEATALLERERFDCIVLDLSLPDGTGYDLLERLAAKEMPHPPVIVYTGRDIDRHAEERLRRYSRSIIIKGARSPERLLDEVTLFLHQVESKLPEDRRRMLRDARDREAAFEGKRILVVEDDVRNLFALSSVLEPKGARIEIARNGREALTALEKLQADGGVDLVLMDVMMPEMDGLEATRRIRQRPEWRNVPVITLTAKATREDQARCIDAGANDYIAKPLDVEKLLSLSRVWMRR